ncbi:MAG: bifunctional diguanylate cyclase/phosphodiesterase [Cyanobacteria bacterium P01_D01_bin.105]
MNVPDVVQSYLAEKMIAHKSMAYLQVSAAGHFIDAAGELAKYGLTEIAPGDYIGDRLSFLEGFFPLSARAEVLPQVNINRTLIVDIHLIPNLSLNEANAESDLLTAETATTSASQQIHGWVLFLDTTTETQKQQKLQQQGNELSLLRHQQSKDPESNEQGQPADQLSTAPFAARNSILSRVSASRTPSAALPTINSSDGLLLSHLFSALNLLVLECTGPAQQHQLRVIGQIPEWAAQRLACFGQSSASITSERSETEQIKAENITADKISPFLENFLYDADIFWQASSSQAPSSQMDQSPYLRSGVWSEADNEGTDLQLEAIALSNNSRNIILIEYLDGDQSEKFQWLQQARQNQLNFIAAQKEAAGQLRNATSYDKLTGLPNRSLFLSELENSFEVSQWSHTRQFALVILNLDRFQLLNNSLGSEIGDQVLIAVANRIQSCLRQFDIPVRFSSDEFGILLDRIETEQGAKVIVERLLESINQPFIINDNKTHFTASAGIVLSAPWYHHSRDLLRDASLAMQEAKLKARGHYTVFRRDMRTRAFEQWSLESALDNAIEKNELTLFYQPIVSLSNNRVEGFEALIRWQHPTKGTISPAKFIPLAESSGHILAIDHWVLQEACRTIQQWRHQTGSKAYLNINISPQHFETSHLFRAVQSAIQQFHIPPNSICLEITESCLLEDTQTVVKTLNQLKALGVQVAIDDFGTGYASLGYLQDLPLDKLKIDGYFIEMMKSNGSDIVNTVVELAHRLNFNVTAERVETVEQYQTLQQLGCDMGQGYLFAKPLPSEEAQSFINAQVVVPRGTAER